MREQDFNRTWEENGSKNLIAGFFSNPKIEPTKIENIKQLALEKLANEKYSSENTLMSKTYTQNNWYTKILKGLRNFWWRWQWKLAFPVVVLVMLFFIGTMQLIPRIGAPSYSTSNKGGQLRTMVGGAVSQQAASKDMAFTSNESIATSPPKLDGSQNMVRESEAVAIKAGTANSMPSPILPVPSVPPADPNLTKKITHNLNATLQVSNISETINKLNQDFQQMGGYVVAAQQNGLESGEYGHITAKIPAEKFENFRTSLPNIGKILSQSQTANDITNQYYDAQTRLQNWEAEQFRYMDILKQAKNVQEILQVEGALANIRQQIEQLKGQLRLWNNEVDYSTIQLELQSTITPDLKVRDPWQPVSWLKTWKATQDAVLKTISSTWNVLNYGLVGLGYAFPYLLLLGIIYTVYRLLKKRQN